MSICIKTKYFHLNRILLLVLGLWPYHQSIFVRFQITLCFSLLTSFIIFQLATFLTAKCTPYLIIKVFSVAMFCSTYIINYNAFWLNVHNIRCFMDQLQQIYDELKDENEINIMKEYGNNVKRYTFVIILFAMCGLTIVILAPILISILDIALHINGSQSHQILYLNIMSEYFIDQNKYFYIILLHVNAVVLIGGITITATGTFLRGYLIYACALFKIASYRIDQAMKIKMLENTKNEIMIYKKIISAVDIQRKAIKYAQSLLSNFEGSLFLLVIINVLSLSLNLFIIFQSVSIGNKEEFIMHFLIVLDILLYIFLANYTGQEVIDHNNYVYITAYNVRWYVTSVHTQKLILFILRRSTKAVNLTVGNILVASLECFATLLKASMSYFTFMYSTQQ